MGTLSGARPTCCSSQKAFVHKDLLAEFFWPEYESLREEVDHLLTGEDIMFGFMYGHNHNKSMIPMLIPKGDQAVLLKNKGQTLFKISGANRATIMVKMYSFFGPLDP